MDIYEKRLITSGNINKALARDKQREIEECEKAIVGLEEELKEFEEAVKVIEELEEDLEELRDNSNASETKRHIERLIQKYSIRKQAAKAYLEIIK